MPGTIIYVIETGAETKILKEKTIWTVPVLKVFTLSYELSGLALISFPMRGVEGHIIPSDLHVPVNSADVHS